MTYYYEEMIDTVSELSKSPPPVFFSSIPIDMPLKMIMMRLGYRPTSTVLTSTQREKTDRTITDAFSFCRPRGCWRRIGIAVKRNDRTILQDGSVLESVSLAALLRESDAVALMASTVGAQVVEAASEAMNRGEGATATIYDAVGGQSADAAMNWINNFIRTQVSRHAERLTKQRFSPGYGDLGLENQKVIHSLLDLGRLGITLSSRFMLIPEKSVTAIAGIENG